MTTRGTQHGFETDRVQSRRQIIGEGTERGIRLEAAGKAVGYAAVTFGYSLEFGGRDAFLDEFFLSETVPEELCTLHRNSGFSDLIKGVRKLFDDN